MSVLTVSSLLTPFCLDSLQLTIAPTAPLTRHADLRDTCCCSPLRVSAVGSVPSTPGRPSLCLGAQPSLVPSVTLFWAVSFLTGRSLVVPPPPLLLNVGVPQSLVSRSLPFSTHSPSVGNVTQNTARNTLLVTAASSLNSRWIFSRMLGISTRNISQNYVKTCYS